MSAPLEAFAYKTPKQRAKEEKRKKEKEKKQREKERKEKAKDRERKKEEAANPFLSGVDTESPEEEEEASICLLYTSPSPRDS